MTFTLTGFLAFIFWVAVIITCLYYITMIYLMTLEDAREQSEDEYYYTMKKDLTEDKNDRQY